MFSIAVEEEQLRNRVDMLITKAQPRLSRGFIKRLCHEGKVLFRSKPVEAGFKPKSAGMLTVDYDLAELDKIRVTELPVLYEDKDVLVIDKPAGIITHNRGRYWDEPSVASFIRSRFVTSARSAETDMRWGIVHRLDRATSGLLICAKHPSAQQFLQEQFSERTVDKEYVAVIEGRPKNDEALLDWPIARNPKKPQTFYVHINGKPSQTKYAVLKNNNHYSLVSLKPLTGRTHQLRVHMKHLGFPILGDTLYGGSEAERLFLHAASITLTLPDKTKHTFQSPIPQIFYDKLA